MANNAIRKFGADGQLSAAGFFGAFCNAVRAMRAESGTSDGAEDAFCDSAVAAAFIISALLAALPAAMETAVEVRNS